MKVALLLGYIYSLAFGMSRSVTSVLKPILHFWFHCYFKVKVDCLNEWLFIPPSSSACLKIIKQSCLVPYPGTQQANLLASFMLSFSCCDQAEKLQTPFSRFLIGLHKRIEPSSINCEANVLTTISPRHNMTPSDYFKLETKDEKQQTAGHAASDVLQCWARVFCNWLDSAFIALWTSNKKYHKTVYFKLQIGGNCSSMISWAKRI